MADDNHKPSANVHGWMDLPEILRHDLTTATKPLYSDPFADNFARARDLSLNVLIIADQKAQIAELTSLLESEKRQARNADKLYQSQWLTARAELKTTNKVLTEIIADRDRAIKDMNTVLTCALQNALELSLLGTDLASAHAEIARLRAGVVDEKKPSTNNPWGRTWSAWKE